MARPTFKPTDKDRMQVEIMASCGMPHKHIASRVMNPGTNKPIDEKTLRRAFRVELDTGMQTANGLVAQNLFKIASGGQGAPAVHAAKFWLASRAGWKATEKVELSGHDGAPIETNSKAGVDEQAVRAIVQRLRSEF